jgi:hypothetical protein
MTFVNPHYVSTSHIYYHNLAKSRTGIEHILVDFGEQDLGKSSMGCSFDLLTNIHAVHAVDVDVRIHSTTDAEWTGFALAELY